MKPHPLKKYRGKISQSELARRIDVTPAYIGHIEQGVATSIAPETVEKIAKVFNMSPAKVAWEFAAWLCRRNREDYL